MRSSTPVSTVLKYMYPAASGLPSSLTVPLTGAVGGGAFRQPADTATIPSATADRTRGLITKTSVVVAKSLFRKSVRHSRTYGLRRLPVGPAVPDAAPE